ncbi:MAG: YihY/virulence factor BrkB family protein [Hungatella hathewayi]|nr:YihY/virulence factor BrkB family protein [Hungatella hathewayi]
MVSLIVEGKRIYDKFTKDEVTVYAAQASFFIVLSFFPFIMLLLTLIQFIPNISKSDLMTITVAIMPDMLDSFVVGIIDDLYTKSPATIVSITAITALWSASRGMLSIERSLNRVNEISRKRNYIVRRIICAGYTIVFIFACVGSLIFLVLGSSLQRLIDRLFPLIGEIISFIVSFRSVAAMAILIVAFMALYAYLPSKNQKLRNQVPGALFSAAGWTIFSYLFSMYFDHFSNFSYMYGSLTAIVLLMLWLYICICILLIGAEINYHYTKNYR